MKAAIVVRPPHSGRAVAPWFSLAPWLSLAPASPRAGHAAAEAKGEKAAPGENDPGVLNGKRVLIVEDEFFLALLVEEALQSAGCDTLGPLTTLERAMQAALRERFDAAVLDINLGGKAVYPLADELIARAVPFVFLTGYTAADLPAAYRRLYRVQKPFDADLVRATLARALSRPA